MFIFLLVSNDAGEGALLLIRKENARKGSESNQKRHLGRLHMADNVFTKSGRESEKRLLDRQKSGRKKVGFVTEPKAGRPAKVF